MSNMVSYVRREVRSFTELPFSEVDSLVLSWLVYLHYPEGLKQVRTEEGLNIREIFKAEYFDYMFQSVKSPEDSLDLLAAVCASPRFRNIRVFGYEHDTNAKQDKQFAAICFQLTPALVYVAYRGTDSSFTGWKEDMNLVLIKPVPSQKEAVRYLEKAAAMTMGVLLVGGHSKGGNIAVYAAANCEEEVQQRIMQVYTHDGPGFNAEEVESEGFVMIRDRIRKTLPQSSLIGMIMEQECDYRIIHSTEKSVQQHNPFSWEIENGVFTEEKALTPDAVFLYKTINLWASRMSDKECKIFIDAVFEILDKTKTGSFDELGPHFFEKLPEMIKETKGFDAQTKKTLIRSVKELAASGVKSVPQAVKEWSLNFREK